MYCSRSSRERSSVNALNCPANGVTVPAANPGIKAEGWEQPKTLKNENGVASGVPGIAVPSDTPGPLHGVKSAVVVAFPH
jgi:hypothetical protein